MSWWRLIKLVRDDVDKYLPDEGRNAVRYEPIRDPEIARRLRREKVVEEAVEFLADPSISELADVYEAVRCIAEYDPAFVSFEAVINEADAKRAQRGGFELATGMYVITTPPDGRGDESVQLP